jgi:predicted nucleic acid-binding protein
MSAAVFVVDCSVAMAWLFHDEATPKTTALLNRMATETALVPAWWFIEIANVLAMAERKGRITPTQSDAFIADLGKLAIERDDEATDRAFTHLLSLCRKHRLTSYDAIYLDLAIRRSLPLATLDDDLRKAARKLGVALLGS